MTIDEITSESGQPTAKGEGGGRLQRSHRRGADPVGGRAPADERWSILLLTFAGAAMLGFLGLADAVVRGSTASFDERVLLFFRVVGDPEDPLGPLWFEELVRDVTTLGGNAFLLLLVAVVAGFFLIRLQWRAASFLVAAVGGGLLLSLGLKRLLDRARPELVPHGQEVFTASFPSMHSVMATTTFLTLAAVLARMVRERRLRVYFVGVGMTLALLVGVSRIYLGVHWPTDVLAGWVVGGGWTLLCLYIVQLLQRRRIVEPPR